MKLIRSIVPIFSLMIFFTACTEGTETADNRQSNQEGTREMAQTQDDVPQDYSDFSAWDENQDGYISQSEYQGVLKNNEAFEEMDSDRDEAFGPENWGTTTFEAYDEDENQELNQEEWSTFSSTWNREGQWGDFNEVDMDQDDIITQDEWKGSISENETFQNWNSEGSDEDAFNEGFYNYTYNAYDVDRDHQWNESEFDRYTGDWRNN